MPFRVAGRIGVLDLRKGVSAPDLLCSRTRPLGGWLMTYGKLDALGGLVPTRDRDGQTSEYAREIGYVDFRGYDRWNDTHQRGVVVGLPAPGRLEFHGAASPLAKAHRKVGYWTEGWLFDRHDPGSWAGLRDDRGQPRRPTAHEFARADHFWSLANLLKGSPRSLGFSADGICGTTRDEASIVWGIVQAAAVCETPKNPDTTAEILDLATPMRVLAKAQAAASIVPEDLELQLRGEEAFEYIVGRMVELYNLERATAARWLYQLIQRQQAEGT